MVMLQLRSAKLCIAQYYTCREKMVVFVCTACGNSVKKSKVEKHYQIECPECSVLSCIDCGKDFTGDEYQTHTSCISEAEKYQGKLFTDSDRAKSSKGERKQQEWLQKLHEVEKVSTDPTLVRYLKMISAYPNVPRKRGKFENFAHNSLKLHNPRILAQLWDAFSNGSPQPQPPQKQQQPQQQQQKQQQQNDENVEMEVSGRIPERTDKNGFHLSLSEEKADKDGLSPPLLKESHKLKKKRKHKEKELEESPLLKLDVSEGEPVTKKAKKKKKKEKQSDDELVSVSMVTDSGGDGQDQNEMVSKKRKVTEESSHGDGDAVCLSKVNGTECEDNPSSKVKKKKKKKKEKVTNVPSTDSTDFIQGVGITDAVVMSTKEGVSERSVGDVEEVSMDTAQSTQQCNSSGGLSEERTGRRKKKKKNKTDIDVVHPDTVSPTGRPLQTGSLVDEMVTAAKLAAEKIVKSSPNVMQSSMSVAQSVECSPLATFDQVKKKKSKKKKSSKETANNN